MTIKACLKSMRLRTLPLSLSGIVTGIALAFTCRPPEPRTAVFLILTAVCLQILSNLSNELGDTLHGTDTAERLGVQYSIQSGDMSIEEMKRLIGVVAALCCVNGLLMIYFSFGSILSLEPLIFVALGAAAIWAAMHYTLGDNPYGYRGLGDVFVFIFFGLVSTLGAAYICSRTFDPEWMLPAAAIGCFSVGVLNVNNIRDMNTDAATRSTVALKMGPRRARIYHSALIAAGWCSMITFLVIRSTSILSFLPLLPLPLFGLHLKGVWTREGRGLDPMLPMLVMSTFALSIIFFTIIILHII